MRDADGLEAREQRVLGVFLLLLGAGLILDCSWLWFGGLILGLGTLVLAWGTGMKRHRAHLSAAPQTHLESHP